MNHHIPQRLRDRIELHLFRNLAVGLPHVPLILGIEGEPGVGKTHAVDQVARESGVRVFSLSGDRLESPNAGYPAQLIRDTYRAASTAMAERELGAVLVIHDIDTAIGSWGPNVQYTMNRQMVNVALMSLTDSPLVVEGFDTRRVPIILTGNDFSLLHPPLMRPGRLDRFHWAPDLSEKRRIVSGLLPDGSDEVVDRLMEAYGAQSVAFFVDAIAAGHDAILTEALRQKSLSESLEMLRSGRQTVLPPPSAEAILRSAAALADARGLSSGDTA